MFQVGYVDVYEVVYVVGKCVVGYYFFLFVYVCYEVFDCCCFVFGQLYLYECLQFQFYCLWIDLCCVVIDYFFCFQLLYLVQVC